MRSLSDKKVKGTIHPMSGYHYESGNADPPALVECSTCRVVVRAAKGRYRELDAAGLSWVDHAHQPARYARYSDEGYHPERRNQYRPRSY